MGYSKEKSYLKDTWKKMFSDLKETQIIKAGSPAKISSRHEKLSTDQILSHLVAHEIVSNPSFEYIVKFAIFFSPCLLFMVSVMRQVTFIYGIFHILLIYSNCIDWPAAQ